MDRKYRDYYIVTFDREYCWNTLQDEYFRENFTVAHQKEMYNNHAVKVRWYSLGGQPYALLSIKKRYTNSVLVTAQTIRGVDKIIEYTPEKEKAFNIHKSNTSLIEERKTALGTYYRHLCQLINEGNKIAWQKLIKENNEQRKFTQGAESQKR